ncbi:hypothetical protein PG991_003106 [Apiospora marii]|uniref:Uncharacterized protein n=1 Tax=Apiospora marii TaxID=335849 RepID=A0ABR1SJL3_9PEZI
MSSRNDRGLQEEIHRLRNESWSLRLEQTGVQRHLDQERRSNQQLQGRLEEVQKQLREERESHEATKAQLRESEDTSKKLLGENEELQATQAQLVEEGNGQIMSLLAEMEAKENTIRELRLNQGNQEAPDNEHQTYMENMLDRSDDVIAAETQETYRTVMIMEAERADTETKRANEEHARAEQEKARAEAAEAAVNEIREEANDSIHQVNCMTLTERAEKTRWRSRARNLSREVDWLRAENHYQRQRHSDFMTLLEDNED